MDDKQKQMLKIGAAAVLLIVAGVVLAMNFMGGDKAPTETPQSATARQVEEQIQQSAPPPPPEIEELKREQRAPRTIQPVQPD